MKIFDFLKIATYGSISMTVADIISSAVSQSNSVINLHSMIAMTIEYELSLILVGCLISGIFLCVEFTFYIGITLPRSIKMFFKGGGTV